jgi:ribonuclease D
LDIRVYRDDLPRELVDSAPSSVAVDTETMGLLPHRDRLCVAQFCFGDGVCHIVQFKDYAGADNIRAILHDARILKIFHYARFDMAMFFMYTRVMPKNIYCTKIASKLARTYAAGHSLRDLCIELLGIEISKEYTCSDWGADDISSAQQEYAATDVLYLHQIKTKLDEMLHRENRYDLAEACFSFLPHRVMLDLMAGDAYDIFSHSS